MEFDDERLVANAGLLLTSTLSRRLGLERLVEETVDLGERVGGARPGRKLLSLLHAIAAGADSIDDCEELIADRPPRRGSAICASPSSGRRRSPRSANRPDTRLLGPQAELWPEWRYFPFITNRSEPLEVVEAEHRQHAVVETHIADLKDQALAHFPSGDFAANAAWTVIACLAHNLSRWTGVLGLRDPTPRAARTIRRWLVALPGRLTHSARRWTLHLPARWPWQTAFTEALTRIRALAVA